MSQLLVNARQRVIGNRIICVRRSLPFGKGQIEAKVGEEVSPATVLGEGQTPSGFRSIHLATELEVAPDKAAKFLLKKIGDTIFEGELLASNEQMFGLQKRAITSPIDGILDYYNEYSGNLRLKLLPKPNKLVSGVYGVVQKVDESKKEVYIKTLASLIYGVLGSGQERDGLLKVLGSSEALISSKQITEDMKGKIIVGGSIVFADALEKAVEVGVTGIISGGINTGDYLSVSGGSWKFDEKKWSDVGLSLLITEGLGSIPLSEDIFELLIKHHDRFALIDGNSRYLILPSNDQSSMAYIRKTDMQMDLHQTVEVEQVCELKVGSHVRLIANQVIGVLGVVESIDQKPSLLPSGISIIMVTVVTKRRKYLVPYTNLEIIS